MRTKLYYKKFKQTLPRKIILSLINLVTIYLCVDLYGMKGWIYSLLSLVPFTIMQIYIDMRTGYAAGE